MSGRSPFRSPLRCQFSLAALLLLTAAAGLTAAACHYSALPGPTLFLVVTHLGIAAVGSWVFTRFIDRGGS